MAEVGKGDPRWIVKERTDGANVNNWHWTDKCITPWAHARVKEIVAAHGDELSAPASDGGRLEVCAKLDTVDGDCGVMNRKKKMVFYYQLTMKLKWTGTVLAEDGAVRAKLKGTMQVHDVDQDEEADSLDVSCTAESPTTGTASDVAPLLSFVKKGAQAYIASLFSALQAEIKSFMATGCDLASPASPYSPSSTSSASPTTAAAAAAAAAAPAFADAFSDLEEEEGAEDAADASVPTPSLAEPEAAVVHVEVTKDAAAPMGLLLEPTTLELLDVKEGTASAATDAVYCVGLFLAQVNGADVADMAGVVANAKEQSVVRLTFRDHHLEAGRHQESVEVGDKLLDAKAKAAPAHVRHALLQNRAVARLKKNHAFKSNILTSAALDDVKAFAPAAASAPAANYTRCWALLRAHQISSDANQKRECLRAILQDTPAPAPLPVLNAAFHALHSFALLHATVSLDSIAAREGNDAAVLFVRRCVPLLTSGDVRYLKQAYAPVLRAAFKRHANAEVRAFAKKVGKLQKEG